jgi:restriction system protein
MPLPDFQSLMLPMLKFAANGGVCTLSGAREHLATHFTLSPEDLKEMFPSGRQGKFANRVAWAKVYLELAGLLESPTRGTFKITSEGSAFLGTYPEKINFEVLDQFEKFKAFRATKKSKKIELAPALNQEALETPEELFEQSYQIINEQLSASLLVQVKECSPAFFEKLVLDLLLKMGYGQGRDGAGWTTGKPGDEGIDGIISEDRLGLESIYIQAKRWGGTVGRPEIQKFVGALQGKHARKGVLITTGKFSPDARNYVGQISPRVVLIDGNELSVLMVEYKVGIAVQANYELKRIDTDFFTEE